MAKKAKTETDVADGSIPVRARRMGIYADARRKPGEEFRIESER